MKKITLFFAALAVVFSVSAQDWGGVVGNLTNGGNAFLGSYDPVTNVFTENTNPTQVVEFNPNCFSMAILIELPAVVELCAANPTYTMVMDGVRMNSHGGDAIVFANGGWGSDQFPIMTRVDGALDLDGYEVGGVVFYICGYDLGTITGGLTRHLNTNIFLANVCNGDETQGGFWYEMSMAAGTGGYVYLGDDTEQMVITSTCPTCTYNDPVDGCESSIANVYASEMNAEIVGFYNMLGQKLAGEPEKGMFIVKYSNGKSIKISK